MTLLSTTPTAILSARCSIYLLHGATNATLSRPSGGTTCAWRKQGIFVDIAGILKFIKLIQVKWLQRQRIITSQRMHYCILVHFSIVFKGKKRHCILLRIMSKSHENG